MLVHGRVWRGLVSGIVIMFMFQVLAIHAWGAPASLGTVRGSRAVELTLNGDRTWLPLRERSYPVMAGMQLRSKASQAAIELIDGSRINLLPFSMVQVQEAQDTIEISLLHGSLTFQLPTATRVKILTSSARLEPQRQEAMVGELFVNREGAIGLKMTVGTLQVQELDDAQQVRLASLEPVFIPTRPISPAPLFSSDAPPTSSAGAKGVFTPRGESVGYLQTDGQLVVHPRFTADLTRPFPTKLVRLAMATIPDTTESDVMPLFDVNGKYLGYLNGSDYYPQTQLAQAFEGGAGGGGGMTTEGIIALGSIFGVGGGIIGCGLSECFTSDDNGPAPATPIQPNR